jgi:hypothetical protein
MSCIEKKDNATISVSVEEAVKVEIVKSASNISLSIDEVREMIYENDWYINRSFNEIVFI